MSRPRTLKQRLDVLVADMVKRGIRLEEAQDQLELAFLILVMKECDDNQTRAAERLDLHRNTLRRKLERHGLL